MSIEGASFAALRIMGEELNGANPFELLAHRMPEADQVIGDYTLVVAGMQFEAGPGWAFQPRRQ